jgi:hypothetical protein
VPDEQVQVNRLVASKRVLEPLLGDHLGCRDDSAGIAVACEVVEHAKCHDPNTMVSRKISVSHTHVLILRSGRVVDLNVGRYIAVTVSPAEVVEVLISDFAHVELVVPRGENIIVDSLTSRQ